MKKSILFLLPFLFSLYSAFGQFPAGWSGVMRIEINDTVIQGTLSNFPVAVILDSSNFDFSMANSDGSDIRFTDTNNIPLTFERELHDASAQQAVYWVRTSGDMLMYFGNSGAVDASNTTGTVWDNSYLAVWHMEDFGSQGNWFIKNYKNSVYNAVKVNEESPDEVDGIIGKAQNFDRLNDKVSLFTVFDTPAALTISAWVKPETSSPVLDQVSSAVAAYSLRRLQAGYTGEAITVRRSSDDVLEDIGFDAAGNLDTTALINFVGSGNNGYVVTWFDQSGNGQNVSQGTESNQPILVENGIVLKSEGKPMIRFSNNFLDGTVDMGQQYPDATLNAAWRQTGTGTISEVPVFLGRNENYEGLSIGFLRFSSLRLNNIRLWSDELDIASTIGFNTNFKIQTGTYERLGTNSSELQVFLNGNSSLLETLEFDLNLGINYSETTIKIGANENNTQALNNSFLAEVILFDEKLSSVNLETLEQNQSNYYGLSSPIIAGRGRNSYQLEICNSNLVAYVGNDSVQVPATIGEYQHIAMTYIEDTLRLYINGEQVRKKAIDTIYAGSGDFIIGKSFKGIIDEVTVSNTPRTANWIANDFNSGNGDLLVYDLSGFDITDPGQQVAGVPFDLVITNARDFSGDPLVGKRKVIVTSSITTEGPGSNGILFSDSLNFSAGVDTIKGLVLNTADIHTLTVTIQSVTSWKTIDIDVVGAPAETIIFVTPERTITAGDTSAIISIQLLDAFGNTATSTGFTLALESDTTGVFRNYTNTSDITQLIFTDGDTIASFLYTSGTFGSHLLTVYDTADPETLESASQSITVNALPASKIVFITEERTITASDTSLFITLQLQDEFGNIGVSSIVKVIDLDSDTTGVFINSGGTNSITQLTIPIGQSVASFRYTSTIAGTHLLSASDTASVNPFTGDTQVLTVNPSAAFKIAFITPERIMLAGDTSEVITIQIQDTFSNLTVNSTARDILLETDLDGVFLNYSDSSIILNSVITIPAGVSDTSFLFTSTRAGIHEISATDTALVAPLNSASQNLTVNALEASRLFFITDERVILAGDTSDILTVQLQDTYFNPAIRTVNTVFNITSSDTTGIFRDSLNQNNIVDATILAGDSLISFRYTSLVAGTYTISVNDTVTDFPISGDSQELIVTPRLASKIVFINPERTILAGDTSEIITIQLQDIYDNVAVSDEDRGILLETNLTGLFLDSLNVEEIVDSTVLITIGKSEISFWFSSTQSGIHQLSATDTTTVNPLDTAFQNLTVIALDAVKIVFNTPDPTIAAGDTSEIITLQLQDIYNNAAIRSVETGIALQTNAAVTLRDSANLNTITEVSIAENTSEAWIRYTATIPGVYKLFANDTATVNALTGDSLNLTVIAAAPDKIVLISGPSSMSAGDTSALFTIQLQDFYDNVALSSGLTSVRLRTDLTGIFRDSLNLLDVTQVDISDGQSEKSFRYTSTLATVHQLSASDLNLVSPLDSAFWDFTINPLAANKIAFITPVRTIFSGDTSEIITIQLQDTFSNRTVSVTDIGIDLSSNFVGIYLDTTTLQQIVSAITIPADSSEASFYYTSSLEGTHLLTASDSAVSDTLYSGYQNLIVLPELYIWTGELSTDWHIGDNWNRDLVPGATVYIRLDSTNNQPIISSTDVTVRFLDIESGALLTVNAPGNLTISSEGILTIMSGGSLISNDTLTISVEGLLTILPGGSLTSNGILINNADTEGLVLESDASATGSLILNNSVPATVERYMTGNKWHITAPPVAGQDIQEFLTNNNNIPFNAPFYGITRYRESPDGWRTSYFTADTLGVLNPAEGYLLRTNADGVVTFTGNLRFNDTTINVTRADKGWNSIGNPYPSYIKISDKGGAGNFLDINLDDFDQSHAGLYVWDEPNVRVSGASYYKIINNVPVDTGRFINPGYLQPGQGFLMKARDNDSRSVSFTQDMKAHQNNISFFKKSYSTSTPWSIVYLNAKTTTRQATTLIAFNERMTRGLDVTYDAGLLGGDPALSIYTRLLEDNGVNFAIQCLPDMTTEEMIVPVGVRVTNGSTVTFSADYASLPAGYKALLEDRQLGVFTDLAPQSASYTTGVNSGTGRFFLHVVSSTTNIDPADNQKIAIFAHRKEIFIQGIVKENSVARVYDLTGKMLKVVRLEPDPENLNSFSVDELKSGIYIVRIEGKGLVETGKVFID